MAVYMISLTSRGLIISFMSAPFPRLARNTEHSRELRKQYEQGELSVESYEKEKVIEKSKISSSGIVRSQIKYFIVNDTIR